MFGQSLPIFYSAVIQSNHLPTSLSFWLQEFPFCNFLIYYLEVNMDYYCQNLNCNLLFKQVQAFMGSLMPNFSFAPVIQNLLDFYQTSRSSFMCLIFVHFLSRYDCLFFVNNEPYLRISSTSLNKMVIPVM